MKRLLLTLLMSGGLAVLPQLAAAQVPDSKDRVQIEQVVETFRTAIVNKDEEAFLKLFLKEDVTWTGVLNDASAERMYANRPRPEMKRPTKLSTGNPRRFIHSIATDKDRIEETVSNLRIDSDSDVAQVWFDYSFVSGGYKENWGRESWQMVHTAEGWKIAGVVWSVEVNPTPRPTGKAP